MSDMLKKYGLAVPEILLPENVNLSAWSVVACDQFTSQGEYWDMVRSRAFDVPSTLHITYPEAWLDQGDERIASIHRTMNGYLRSVLTKKVRGMILVERTTQSGRRLGLMTAVDLEAYDFSTDSRSLIHATEGTVIERIPPRVKIRKDAPIEAPHILLLADDPAHTLIDPIYAERDKLELLYDFELMLGGGHLRGWLFEDAERLVPALEGLYEAAEGLLFAVGDGNHSLASARQCWLDIRDSIPEAEREGHPARYALVELTNLHDDALVFEPIHRVMFNTQISRLARDFGMWLHERGMSLAICTEERAMFCWTTGFVTRPYIIQNCKHPLPLALLQEFLDEWLKIHREASIDYVHGEEATRTLAQQQRTVGIMVKVLDKHVLFESVRKRGALPRKAFSMGEATEKRYYLECRKIKP